MVEIRIFLYVLVVAIGYSARPGTIMHGIVAFTLHRLKKLCLNIKCMFVAYTFKIYSIEFEENLGDSNHRYQKSI